MITKIKMSNVASYKGEATLETDKKINLIYGLNGTGKSTLSNYLYKSDSDDFSACSIEGLNNEKILVYNEKFIEDNFYEAEELQGIFTLSKENKEIAGKIQAAENERSKLMEEKESKLSDCEAIKNNIQSHMANAHNTVFKIKTTYAGGDRILEYCLEKLKNNKANLYKHISSLPKPTEKPNDSIDKLKKEAEALKGNDAGKIDTVSKIMFDGKEIESNTLLDKVITGSRNSAVSELINKLGNSDWVKEGMEFLAEETNENKEVCPFCQQKTITQDFTSNIKAYFDKTYESDINALESLLSEYRQKKETIKTLESFKSNKFIAEDITVFTLKHNSLISIVDNNIQLLEDKIRTPRKKIILNETSESVDDINKYIDEINRMTSTHNEKIENLKASLADIKNRFWNLMRWDYDQTISNFETITATENKKIEDLERRIEIADLKINEKNDEITRLSKGTTNIEEAITNIQSALIQLGIDSFKIIKYTDSLYKIAREGDEKADFRTLSEGEKTIIGFLYFCELCKGKAEANESTRKKIIVIDDPISSLSHIYIFNVGELIKGEFFKSDKYEQVFMLTHSLYFFYELACNEGKKEKNGNYKSIQKLFRMRKNTQSGTEILEMKYNEIQNDYQAYWSIVKDRNQPPAIIANCMRNIIEYFFSFIEKKDFTSVFDKQELKLTKYQAFCRYANRESHSDGQNLLNEAASPQDT